MYELGELEKKWIAYKKQKYKKIGYLGASFAAVALLSFGAAYMIFSGKGAAQSQKQEINDTARQTLESQPIVAATPMASPAVSVQQPQKEIVIISPEEKKEEFKNLEPKTEQRQQDTQTRVVQSPQQQKPQTPPKITIETKNADPIDTLAEKYAKNPDAQTALALSELLYKKGSYQKALKWAINANSIDPKNERSWIMFAKSSYKLGRKQDALNALDNFARTNPSEAVKETISHIKNDEY